MGIFGDNLGTMSFIIRFFIQLTKLTPCTTPWKMKIRITIKIRLSFLIADFVTDPHNNFITKI